MQKGTDQKDKLTALRRIEGQIRGVQGMIEERRYCVDILNAVGAIVGALKKVEADILRDHLHGCVMSAARKGSQKEKEAKLEEIHRLFRILR